MKNLFRAELKFPLRCKVKTLSFPSRVSVVSDNRLMGQNNSIK